MSETEDEQQGFVPKKQHLFLIEFLIDTVHLDPQGFCDEVMEGQTCVTLKFLSFPQMTICEKDFDPNKEPGVNKIRFNSGKSLMFAFSEKQCEEPPPMFAELVVSKKFAEESESNLVDLGKIKICMGQIFQQLYEVAKFTPDRLPVSKSIKDCFMLVGRGKRTVGEVLVYVRLTCLGQNVVTEFQCGADMKQDPVLFKNKEGKKVYEFMGTDKDEDECQEEGNFREGCGCLGLAPPPPPKSAGGRGDAGSPRRTPMSGACAKGRRVVLDIPNKPNCGRGERNAAVRLKQSEDQGRLIGSLSKKERLTASQVNSDPDQNCFVLKVGDKGQIPDRGKMVLEFRTPKQKILPKEIPPYHEDIGVQTDSAKKSKGKRKREKGSPKGKK